MWTPSRLWLLVAVAGWILASSSISGFNPSSADTPTQWETLEPGLDFHAFQASSGGDDPERRLRILRIDPRHFRFRLLNSSARKDQKRLRVSEWAHQAGLVAAINASMFQEDNKTSVSMMRTGDHVNNGWLSKDKTLFAFDPKKKSLPKIQIIDRECQDARKLIEQYGSVVQSIRMVSCKQRNVWAKQAKRFSMAVLGVDRKGRALFIHSSYPSSPHDLIERLLALPIQLERAMYLEGGATAQMYIQTGDREMEFLGGFSLNGGEGTSTIGFPVPNVIGIERVTSAK